MKIIKNNYKEPIPEYPKTIECPGCFSTFLVESKYDIFIKKEYSTPHREIIEEYECIICPCCKNEIRVCSLMPIECENCGGCGWYEGDKSLQTTCENCGGTGIIYKQRKY